MSFRAGVDEVLLEGIRRTLCNSAKFQAQSLPLSRIRYDHDRNRWEVDPRSGGLVSGENKIRFYRKDLSLLSHQVQPPTRPVALNLTSSDPLVGAVRHTYRRSQRVRAGPGACAAVGLRA